MSANQREGRRVNRAEQFKKFDRHSPEMRRLISLAPYDYVVPPLSETPQGFINYVFNDRDRCIAKTYGKTHPQIGSRMPERRPTRLLPQ